MASLSLFDNSGCPNSGGFILQKVKPYIILNTSRKHVNYEEDKNKVPMNKPYNIQNTNICNSIFHISFFKALLINESETTRGERE
jgi:hypothetical protein